jgi:hypothetical protein
LPALAVGIGVAAVVAAAFILLAAGAEKRAREAS